MLVQPLMLFQDSSRELSLLELLFLIVLRRPMLTEQLDKSGTTKEMRERDFKRLKKLNKKNDWLQYLKSLTMKFS